MLDLSNSKKFYRTTCLACGGPFEFPAEGTGQTVPCPHCESLVTLKKPHRNVLLALGATVVLILSGLLFACWGFKGSGRSLSESEKDHPLNVSESDAPEAINQAAFKYFNGDGYKKDPQMAARLWAIAAEKGDAKAQLNFGLCFLEGKGVAKDAATGVQWIRKAAEAGLSEAEFEMGFLLSSGIGVPKSPAEAIRWHLKAAEKGVSRSFANLGYCYSEGFGVPKNLTESAYWYRKAAESGEFAGFFGTAISLHSGVGAPKDLTEAYKWYLLASTNASLSDTYDANQRNYKAELAKVLGDLKSKLAMTQIEDAEQRAARFVASKTVNGPCVEQDVSLALIEPFGNLEVKIERVLIGQRTVDYEVFHSFPLEGHRKRGREAVYFLIAVKNIRNAQSIDVSYFGFNLRDDKGDSYPAEQSRDYLHGKIFPGDTLRGGLIFAVEQGNTPSRLVYDPGLITYVPGIPEIPAKKIVASTFELDGLRIFKRPVEKRRP